ncbi:unnamed protein product, partial [Symbiodinium pilosum]
RPRRLELYYAIPIQTYDLIHPLIAVTEDYEPYAARRRQCRNRLKEEFPWTNGVKTSLLDGNRVPDEVVGPLIAGRLQGRAQRIALELKLVRPDGTYDIGDAALVRLSVDEVIDPVDGVTIIQRHIPSGVQALCNALRDAFGDTDEAQTTKALEVFFEHKRPHGQELQEFAAEWDLRYEDAKLKAGLDMNTVAKSYLWLKQSGLTQKHQDDLRLQVHGDLSRFNELRALAILCPIVLLTGPREDKSDEHAEMDDWFGWTDWDDDGYWTEAWWYDNDWEDYGDGYNDHSWYEDDDEFYEAEEQP